MYLHLVFYFQICVKSCVTLLSKQHLWLCSHIIKYVLKAGTKIQLSECSLSYLTMTLPIQCIAASVMVKVKRIYYAECHNTVETSD